MCGATLVVVFGLLRWTGKPGARRTTSMLCMLWLPCFAVYVVQTLAHMF